MTDNWQDIFTKGNEDRIVHREEAGLILYGDCLKVMGGWPDGCVDLVCTDPPYNCKAQYTDYTDALPAIEYEAYAKAIANIVDKYASGQAVLVLGSQQVKTWWLHFSAAKQIIVRSGATSHNKAKNLHLQYRPILTTVNAWKDGEAQILVDLWEDIRWPTEGYFFPEDRYGHPAMSPLCLMERCVEYFSRPGAIICDCHNGSGTTCVAAKKLGRRFVGIDISKEYCQIARDRLKSVDTGVPVKEARQGQKALFE